MILKQIQRVVDLDTPILLTGESGVGKDHVARIVHGCSHRAEGPYIKLDCGSIPEELFESELFGFEKGAFTDAYETKLGKLELAHGGTVYLDNICALPLSLQAKLLRVFEDRSFCRLGGHRDITVNARFIISCNRDLQEMVREGAFRKDLFYRMNILSFPLPPLRDRKDDIPLLAAHFVKEMSKKHNKKITGLNRDTHSMLMLHVWRGNIRELKNAIERSVIMCNEDRIFPHHLPLDTFVERDFAREAAKEYWPLDKLEEIYIRVILRLTHSNQSRAAKILGISRKTLLEKRKKYNIDV